MNPVVMTPQSIPCRPRHKRLMPLATGFLAALLIAAFALPGLARPVPDGFADLAEKTLPAVVNISTSQDISTPFGEDENGRPNLPPGIPDMFRDFFENRRMPPRQAQSMGSGFIIDSDGIVITNNHVIDRADEIIVILEDGTELEAEVIGTDSGTDLAVLKVAATEPLPSVEFADSDNVRVGEWAMAVGNPFGLGGTVTAGIISAVERDILSGPYTDFIQTDAAINQGNSGGPLFDMDGRVIGINSVIISRTGGNVGIGFAIPSNLAQDVIADLREYGQVKRGWLGVGIQPIDEEIAESVGLDKPEGVMISNVMEDEPADKAGMESGDVILEFNNSDVPDTRTLLRLVGEAPSGETVPLVVWRDGKRKTLRVTVGERQADEARATPAPGEPGGPVERGRPVDALGMTLSPLTDEIREQADVADDVSGVIVTQVSRISDAAQKGIRRGDVIVRIGDTPVSGISDVTDTIKEHRDDGKKSILLRLRRGDSFLFVALKLDDEE